MVKQKVEMKLAAMTNAKMRTKALQTVAGFQGITSVALEGEKIVVTGDGIDPVSMTQKLRKKMRFAELISVSTIVEKKPPENKPKEKPEEKPKKPGQPAVPPPAPAYMLVEEIQDGQPPCCRIV